MRTSRLNLKHTLLLGGSVAGFALVAAPAMAQNNNGSGQETVIVTGTPRAGHDGRRQRRAHHRSGC